MIIVLSFEGRIKIGKICLINKTNQTNKQTWVFMKSLKIVNGYSETVNRRRTDKTMTKEKYKRTNNDLKYIHIKTKDQVTRTPLVTPVVLI